MDWQPIETAPKGQRLIVSNGKWFGPAAPLSDGTWFMWCSFFEPWDYERRNERPNCIVPTHWMPLPEPPNA